MSMVIAVLALQGAFAEHEKKISERGLQSFEIRQLHDINRSFDGLIIPGGESTVQGKLMRDLELFGPIKKCIEEGLPVFGTCAGMILLAQNIEGGERSHLATMPVTVKRNAYGRQLGSFFTRDNFNGREIPMSFIRAPYISDIGSADILAETGGKIVAARYENQLVTAFHPELCDDMYVYEYFISMMK